MGKLILRFLMLFKPIYQRMGLDAQQLQLILETKLMCEDRIPNALFGRKDKKSSKFMLLVAFGIQVLMGLILLAALGAIEDRFTSYGLALALFSILLSIFLVTDFSTILFDTKDQYVILPKPVSDRTLSVSRILHMAIKVISLGMGLGVPILAFTGVRYGLVSMLLLALALLLGAMVALFAVSIFYLMVVKFFPVSKIKSSITYMQIVLSILIFFSYYIGPRLLASEFMQTLVLADQWWVWLLPIAWPAALLELSLGNFSYQMIGLSALALLLPLFATYFIRSFFSKGFGEKLSALAQGESVKVEKKRSKTVLAKFFSERFTGGGVEEASFLHVWYMTARSNKLKMQLYPTLVYLPVYFIVMFLLRDNEQSFNDKYTEMLDTGRYIYVFYFTGFSLFSLVQIMTRSDAYKSAWVYYVAPITIDGEAVSGALKAVIIKFYLSFMVFFLILSAGALGFGSINDVLLSTAVGLMMVIILALFTVRAFPFSLPEKATEKNRTLFSFLILGVMGGMGYLHSLIFRMEGLVWGLTAALVIIVFFMFKYLKREQLVKVVHVDE